MELKKISYYEEFTRKIYATPNFDRRWQTKAIDDESIEYTRTDIFIEKVCEWLENHNDYQRVLDNGRGVRFDMTQCVSDFRKAMKGE